MRLLLDTHAFLWWVMDDRRLGVKARTAIAHPSSVVHVSAASCWEMAIKAALGKLKMPMPYEQLIPGAVEARGFEMLPIISRHLYELLNQPFYHRDPFDRLIIAQAKVEGMTIVTRNPHFPPYGVPILW